LERPELKDRHAERKELRAALDRGRSELESLRAAHRDAASRSEAPATDENDSLLLPEEVLEEQPPRLPEFHRQFAGDLSRVPAAVARASLRLVGRLAAGEAAAFRGARRLGVDREIWRQRVGLGHRLVFRTSDDALVVLGLVTRQDFPRFVRSLA
jgi:hypothetical protein